MQTLAPDVDTVAVVPRHVAIIMDGNNRWGRAHGLQGVGGHERGEHNVRTIVEAALHEGIAVLTLFAFSSENWRRPADEVEGLMRIFLHALRERVPVLHEQGVQLRFIGDISAFSPALQDVMQQSVAQTAGNHALVLNIAVNYGGQWDMAQAAVRLCHEALAGRLAPDQVTPQSYASYLSMADLPPVDLLIRTGGEHRISNFILWQAAYAELYFSDLLWPDFGPKSLKEALNDFCQRERRFGRTSDQVRNCDRA